MWNRACIDWAWAFWGHLYTTLRGAEKAWHNLSIPAHQAVPSLQHSHSSQGTSLIYVSLSPVPSFTWQQGAPLQQQELWMAAELPFLAPEQLLLSSSNRQRKEKKQKALEGWLVGLEWGENMKHNKGPSCFKWSWWLMGTYRVFLKVNKQGRDFHADSPSCQKHFLFILLASVINGDELMHCVGRGNSL